MNGLRIVSTGKALPKKMVSNEELSKRVDTSDEWITSRTGIKNRYVCEEESCVSLAVMAGKNAVEKSGIDKEQIGVVIVATSTPNHIVPSVACMVAKNLELEEEVMAFDLSAACTGFLYGMGIANGLLSNLMKPYALVIGSEQMSNMVDYEDRASCILFGDGAGAAVLERSTNRFVQRSWTRGNERALYCEGIAGEKRKLSMNGKDVFKFAVVELERAIRNILETAKMSIEDLDYVICHQANARIVEHVKKKFKGYEEKFPLNIENYGNTSAASIPMMLSDLFEAGKLKPGMKIVCVGFGGGLTWSSAYMEL